MKVQYLLLEQIVKLTTPEERRPYADYIWSLLKNTYQKYASGLSGADLSNLVDTPGFWKVVFKNGKIVAGIIYRNSYGHKVRLVFHDDTITGKQELKSIIHTDIIGNHTWGEFSGRLEQLILNMGGKPIPNTEAERILGQKVLHLDPDGYHYTREVSPGVIKTQILIGGLK